MNKYFKFSYAIIVLILVIISGCSKYTQTKAIEQVNKANDNYPAPVADWLRSKYPCITKSFDTVTLTKDSVIYIECPEITPIPASDYGFAVESGDTQNINIGKASEIVKYVKVPVTLPVRTQIITKYIEDSAKIKVMAAAISGLEIDKIKLQSELDNAKEKRNWWRKMCLITWAIIGLTVAARLYFKKPF